MATPVLTQQVSMIHIPTIIHRVKSERTFEIGRYNKNRFSYHRQIHFTENHDKIPHSLLPNRRQRSNFAHKTVVENGDNTCEPHRTASTNTVRAEFKHFSLMHSEGAWPKEINVRDVEVLDRTKKKMQKEETYMAAIPVMAKEADYLARYNNTLPLYNRYFEENSYVKKKDTKPYANVVSVYKCPSKLKRPISKITFSPDNGARMAVAYCPYEFDQSFREHNCEAFFWEVDNPTRPESLIRAASQIVDVRYHPKEVQNICGALFTGQVATWDNRVGPNPQLISPYEVSHEDVCTSAMWINSKTGCEFFSCGLDGKVIWWDYRNLTEPLDYTYADPNKGKCDKENAVPITLLEYEHTLPTKFLVGTQFGQVMCFMKKGKTPQDRLALMYQAHKGPVRSIHRNPVFIKNFMSCGDYHLRVFAEDCRNSGIMWTAPSDALYSYAHWLSGRPCALVACRVDGCLEFWDLLIQGASSILTTKVSEEALSTVWPAETGTHVAAGTVVGDIRMVRVCPCLHTFEKGDKSALAGCFDRESRREKYLEQRSREIRLAKRQLETKLKEQGAIISANEDGNKADPFQNENLVLDKNFFNLLIEEKQQQGLNALPEKKLGNNDDENNATNLIKNLDSMSIKEKVEEFIESSVPIKTMTANKDDTVDEVDNELDKESKSND